MKIILASACGWARLLTSAAADAQLADPDIDKLTCRVVAGRLALPVETADGSPVDAEARGVLAAAWTLSGETCALCADPGDPVELASGERSTRCRGCRGAEATVLPREWRTAIETAPHAYPTLDDLVGAEDLAALMDARHAPGDHRGWPAAAAGGRARGLAVSATGHAGWNHLVRAALALLLPDECAGAHTPWRLRQLKERLGDGVKVSRRLPPRCGGGDQALSDSRLAVPGSAARRTCSPRTSDRFPPCRGSTDPA